MSYDNKFSLKLENSVIDKPIIKCNKCGNIFESGKYCPNDGTELIIEAIQINATKEIIKKLRLESEDVHKYIKNDGSSNESGSGYDMDKYVIIFSNKYPMVLFILTVQWDSGFGDLPTIYYIKNGKSYKSEPKLVYDNYDESKLK